MASKFIFITFTAMTAKMALTKSPQDADADPSN